MKTLSFRLLIVSIAMFALSATRADAADRKAELQARFEQRDAQLQSFKRAGTVGETTEGLIEPVKRDATDDELNRFVREENADRQELYELLAKETNEPAKVVAERAAKRNYQRARPGDFLKTADGQWKQKS